MNLPQLDQPVIIFSLAFGPVGVIIVLYYIRSWRSRRNPRKDGEEED